MKWASVIVLVTIAGTARAQSDAAYELRAADATVVVGAPAAISLTIAPAAGKIVSHDGPVRVELSTDDGLALAKRRYARKDAADPAADAPRFELKLKALAAGDHAIELDVRFWLCGAKVCRPVRAKRTVVVHVAAAPAPDAGAAP
jgi:hypothetical protein